jgi:hypothetical protein
MSDDRKSNGEPGSPSATTAPSGKQLPQPDPKFGGVIQEKASELKAWWLARIVPPKGAPNVLLIMRDDSGFGTPGYLRFSYANSIDPIDEGLPRTNRFVGGKN